MKTIDNYLSKLKKELLHLNSGLDALDEYRLHLNESFEAFKKLKTNTNMSISQIEDIFVDQLEPVDQIAKSLIGLEVDVYSRPGKMGFSQLGTDIKSVTLDVKTEITETLSQMKVWYLNHRTPPMTSLVYLLYGLITFVILLVLELVLPDIGLLSCGDNPSFLHIGNPNSDICASNQSNYFSMSYQPLKGLFLFTIFVILIAALILRLGYKNSYKYSFISSLSLSLIIIPILSYSEITFFINSQILSFDRNLMPDYLIHSWYGVSNWHFMNPLPLSDTTVILFLLIFRLVSFVFVLLFSLVSIGKLFSLLTRDLFHFNAEKLKNITKTIIILVILIGYAFLMPFFVFTVTNNPMPNPLVDNNPLVYSFSASSTTKTYSGADLSGEVGRFNSSLPAILGNISFELYGNLNASIEKNTFTANQPSYLACISPILATCNENNQTHSVFGTFFFQTNQTNESLQKLNSSNPFPGYSPTIDNNNYSILWEFFSEYYIKDTSPNYINVTTINYSSQTNSSIFTFSFDRTTGFLLLATLKLDGGSWARGLEMNVLAIRRFFIVNIVNDPNYFSTAHLLLNVLTLSIAIFSYGTIILLFIYYKKKWTL